MDGIPNEKKMCHRTGFEKSCRDLCISGKCQDRWVNVLGRNVQTNEEINKWGCIDELKVALDLSIESKLLGIQAAIESRGNDTVKLLAEGIARQAQQHKEALGFVEDGRRLMQIQPPHSHVPMLSQELIAQEDDGQLNLLDYVKSNGSGH